jgi:hypothetical protein
VADPARLQYYRLVHALTDVADLAADAVRPETEALWRSTASRLVATQLSPAGLFALADY